MSGDAHWVCADEPWSSLPWRRLPILRIHASGKCHRIEECLAVIAHRLCPVPGARVRPRPGLRAADYDAPCCSEGIRLCVVHS